MVELGLVGVVVVVIVLGIGEDFGILGLLDMFEVV